MAAVLTDDQDRWKRRISNNAAAALLVFTSLHIICFMAVAGYTGWRWINLLGIAIMIMLVIPAISKIEARWEALTREPLGPAEISTHFRRERLRLWVAAIFLPFLGSAVFLGLHALTG